MNRKSFLLVLGLWSIVHSPVFAQKHIAYIEKRGTQVREFSARVEGNEIYFNKRVGSFPDHLISSSPWYLSGLPVLEGTVPFVLEDFPPLALQRTFDAKNTVNILGINFEKYQEHLSLKAKDEIIPLTEEERDLSQKLKTYGIQDVSLEGTGEVLVDPKTKLAVAEQFVLSGEVTKNTGKEHWQIEWAFGEGTDRK
ncbi:MAG: hypothetical protein A3H42_00170 [Deltaproteobacteria bacterium RIFCSPLOWO2_02_FULL_46_8]|nr:MAG: hypothetical protein A3H42_00170 [Deltaproteobacteria bacterium RIFCSPLOWO2_02_FULL_46_8]